QSSFAPQQLRFTLSDSTLPSITTKKVYTNQSFKSYYASTSTKHLSEAGVRIWDPNGSREYLDSVGLRDYKIGMLAPVYGFQWRHFGATYQGLITIELEKVPDEDHPKPRLSAILYQRSADLGLGLPFNITSYALLVHMIAQVTKTEPFELVIQLGDAHVYSNHIEPLSEIQSNSARRSNINHFKFEDFQTLDYSPHPRVDIPILSIIS
ncbi:hypothetical protein PSTT_14496, partial [Puccinia striiformis]